LDSRANSLGAAAGAAIFAVAAIVRLLVLSQLERAPLFRTPQLDSIPLLAWARAIAGGDFRWSGLSVHAPGYSCFLGGLLHLLGGSLTAARTVQALFGAGLCVLLASAAASILGRQSGSLTGALAALYGPMIFTELSILSEGLLLFLLGLFLWLLTRASARLLWPLAAGVVLGLAVLVRPTALVFALLLIPALWRRTGKEAGLAIAAALVVIVPAVVAACRSAGGLVPLQGNGGLNFAIGNSPFATGRATARPGAGWDRLAAEASKSGSFGPAAEDRYYYRRTLGEIRRNPIRELGLLASKLVWTFQAEEARDTHSVYFFESTSSILRGLPDFSLLLALAATGLAFSGRTLPRSFWAFLVLGILTCVLLVVGTRYRLPLVLGLLIVAGDGAARVLRALGGGGSRGRVAAILAASLLFSRLARDPENRNFSEEWALTASALEEEHDLFGQRRAVESSLQADPQSPFAWQAAGALALAEGALPEAKMAYEKSAALEPQVEIVQFKIGLIAERMGRFPEAAEAYRRAVALSPRDAESLAGLARCLLSQGRLRESADVFREITILSPGLAQPHSGLARIAQLENRPADALREARRAVELAPKSSEAWFVLASVGLELADVSTAGEALSRAEALGYSRERVAAARGYLRQLERVL
jgi:Tfp pilus assembly protein PilF